MISNILCKGDTIGIIAPASHEKQDIIKEGIKFLEELGYEVLLGKNIYDKSTYLSGTDKDRAEDLMNMFKNKKIKMILCIRGGYGSLRILPYLNWNVIKRNPKIFIGFSDITCLLNEFYKKCDLITFHGPMLHQLFKDTPSQKHLFDLLSSYSRNYRLQLNDDCIYHGSSSVTSSLVGGNLSVICSTLGTPYEINTMNKILFMEEVNEPIYKIDKMLTQLKLAEKLKYCKGFVLGSFTNCYQWDEKENLKIDDLIEKEILSLNKPTITNVSAGHCSPNITIPIGAKVKLDCKNKKLTITDKMLKK